MWADGWTDSHDKCNTRFSEICEAPNIVQFVLFLNIRKTRSYLDLSQMGTA